VGDWHVPAAALDEPLMVGNVVEKLPWRWWPPEMLKKETHVKTSIKSDVFAYGVLIYEVGRLEYTVHVVYGRW